MYQKNKIMVSLVFLIFIFSLGNICNAAISNARPIQLNTPVKGSLPDRNTKNYYAIDLHGDGYIRIDFEHENLTESHIGWHIILYNDESKQIESFNSRWNSPESSSANIGLPAGTYYILVENTTGNIHSKADYVLTVNYNSSAYWEKELNDTVLTATEMQLNQPYTGSLNNRNDKDYYRIDLNTDGYIRIDLEHENLTESHIGWHIILYNDESKQIESFNSRWNSPERSSANIGLPAGTYYILVENTTGNIHNKADYVLTVNYNSSAYWEKELNDTVLTATDMQLNQPYMGTINNRNDKDYYRIDLNTDGYIRIDFEHENLTDSSVGWDIILYNDESKKIESFYSRWNAPQSSSANIGLPAGTYYILVEYPGPGGRHSNADYSLTANDQPENQVIGDETATDIEDEGVLMEDETELEPIGEGTTETINQNTLVEKNELYIPIGILSVIIIILSMFLIKARRKA